MIKFRLCIFCWKSTEVMLFSVHPIRRHVLSIVWLLVILTFITWLRWCLPGFSHCSFKTNKHLMKISSKALLPLKLSPISFSIYGRFLPERNSDYFDSCQWWFSAFVILFTCVSHLTERKSLLSFFLPHLLSFLPCLPSFLCLFCSFISSFLLSMWIYEFLLYSMYYILLSLFTLIVKLSSIWFIFNGLGVTDFKTRTSERNV